jgi:hypothetical protein
MYMILIVFYFIRETMYDYLGTSNCELPYTGFLGELEHLKIKTRFIDESLVRVNPVFELWMTMSGER